MESQTVQRAPISLQNCLEMRKETLEAWDKEIAGYKVEVADKVAAEIFERVVEGIQLAVSDPTHRLPDQNCKLTQTYNMGATFIHPVLIDALPEISVIRDWQEDLNTRSPADLGGKKVVRWHSSQDIEALNKRIAVIGREAVLLLRECLGEFKGKEGNRGLFSYEVEWRGGPVHAGTSSVFKSCGGDAAGQAIHVRAWVTPPEPEEDATGASARKRGTLFGW